MQFETLSIRNADAVTLLIAAATNFKSYNDLSDDPEAKARKYLSDIGEKKYDKILAEHVAEHRRLFRRVAIDLGSTPAAKLPTDERVRNYAETEDPNLAALMFQFGRYMLICSSRPGCEPANLQGIWNPNMHPSWDCKYTTNVNLEMNYWPAEAANLAECFEPLKRFLSDLTETGGRVAKVQFKAGGWLLPHNSDIWRAAAPINGPYWGSWPCGGAWLTTHLWEHYLYHPDKDYLKEVYPIMKGAAQFFLETLVEHPKHKWLVTCPSSSPENSPRGGDRDFKTVKGRLVTPVSITAGPTMDMQILRYLFGSCIEASTILGVDPEFREKLRNARKRLAPNQIGRLGQLQEWIEDWDDPTDHHRHFSHLWGMYPSNEISVDRTPDLAKAVAKSLVLRGEGGTGFGMAWQMCIWARMYDGDRAHRWFKKLVARNTCPNLFSKCYGTLQVDGTGGATAGIAEMLMQSHEGEIHLLPALPLAWPTGRVAGLRARGGIEVDIGWKDGIKLVVNK